MADQAPIVDRIRIIPRPSDFLDRNVGSSGELFFSRDSNSLRVYSGKVAGGYELARADLGNVNITNDDISWIPYDTLEDLPSAADNHGMFAHVHATGKAYYAHAGNWIELANADEAGGSEVFVSETTPTEPVSGNLWLNTTNGALYIFLDDGDTTQWIQPAVTSSGSGGAISDANTLNSQPASYYLDYANFTGNPSALELSAGVSINEFSNDGTLADASITAVPTEYAVKTYVDSAVGSGGVDLTAFSVTQNSASGSGSLTYDNSSGIFTYTPPATSETDTLASVTARGATTSDAVTIDNTLTVDNIVSTNTGTPEITSATNFTITAPDGVILNGHTYVPGPVNQGFIYFDGLGWSYTNNGSLGVTFTRNGARDYTLTFDVAFGDVNNYALVATQQGDANTVTSVNSYTITKNVGNVRIVFGGALEPSVFIQIYEV